MLLQRRSTQPELIDTEPTDANTFEHCLRDLERINRWTLAYRITVRWLDELVLEHAPARLRVLDAGSGHGDMLRRIAAWAQRKRLPVELIGVDRNPHAARIAARATPDGAPIRYITADVFGLPESPKVDVVVSSLFAHHLHDAQLVGFLRWMEARARLGWLINDLQRHPVAYGVALWVPRLLRMNRLVRHDAAVSVARSLDRPDWERLLGEAGHAPPAVMIARRFPFRFAISRIKPAWPPGPTS